MKHIANTEPFREVDNRNNFMLIKQELKRYEKELELKAGKGFLNNNINTIDLSNQTNHNFTNSINNLIKSNFNTQNNNLYITEKRNHEEEYINLSSQKSKKMDDLSLNKYNINDLKEINEESDKINKMYINQN